MKRDKEDIFEEAQKLGSAGLVATFLLPFASGAGVLISISFSISISIVGVGVGLIVAYTENVSSVWILY